MKFKYSIIVFLFVSILSAFLVEKVPQYIVSNLISVGLITWPIGLSPAEYHPVVTTMDFIRSIIIFLFAPFVFLVICRREVLVSLAKVDNSLGFSFLLVSLGFIVLGKFFFGFDLIAVSSLYGTEFTVLYFMVFTIVIVPILEEFFFRGFIFEVLSTFNVFWVVAISAILFSLFHYGQASSKELLWLLLLGVVLGVVRVECNGVLWPSLLHGVNNALAFNWNG